MTTGVCLIAITLGVFAGYGPVEFPGVSEVMGHGVPVCAYIYVHIVSCPDLHIRGLIHHMISTAPCRSGPEIIPICTCLCSYVYLCVCVCV